MKKYLLLSLALTGITAANAGGPLPAKIVSLPFHNQPILSEQHQGLYFDYNMQNQRKIVCQYNDVYKLWTEFRDNGQSTELGVYGESGYFVMTNKGENDESKNQWHADVKGSAKIMTHPDAGYPNQTVSCRYAFDDNP